MTTLDVTDEEALLFQEFCKYHDEFTKLEFSGFFTIKGGAGIVHFDENSKIRKIEAPKITVYKINLQGNSRMNLTIPVDKL